MKKIGKRNYVIGVVILFCLAGALLMIKNIAGEKEADTNGIDQYAEENQIDGESKTKLQELDELNSYGYVGAGYMDVNSDGVEKIYNEYQKYGIVRSDEDGSLSYEGQRIREFMKEDEGWRYFDNVGTIDLRFNKDNNKLEVTSQEEFDERSLILAAYDDYCISQDMAEENPVIEELTEE